MTLSYDFTFLALLGLSVRPEPPTFERQNCLYNPLKKKPCCLDKDGTLRFASDAAILMLYYHLRDNLADERGFHRLLYVLAIPFVYGAHRKAGGRDRDLDLFFAEQMNAQAELERTNCSSVDRAGEPTARCLGRLFSLLSDEEGQKRVLERLGYLMGRWIYLVDALDDLKNDEEQKRYNPFLLRPVQEGSAKEEAVLSLNLTIGEIIKTFELLKTYRYRSILENVVNLGLKSVVERVSAKPESQ